MAVQDNVSSRLFPASKDADAFGRMVEAVTDYAIVLLDPEGRVRSWNAGAERITGHAEDDVIGHPIAVFHAPDAQARGLPQHALATARETGRFEDEGWRVRRNGTRFWAHIVLTRLSDRDGEVLGFVSITRDVTARRTPEELLRQSEERFRLMVESVQDYAIFMLDPGGHIASWNIGAQKAKGWRADEVIGRHFSIFYPPDVVASGWPEAELEYALRDGRFEDEGWRLRKDGSRFWASVVITALFDAEGRHRGFAKVTRDLTSRRRIDQLEDEGRRMAHFLAVLGHELRNPIAPIAHAATLLQQEPLTPAQLQTARDVLSRQTRQLARLVDDLLDMGRVASGKIRLAMAPVDARAVLLQAVESVRPLAEERGHGLRIVVDERAHDDGRLWLRGDHARLVQVITNLLDNAVKYTPGPGGVVSASLRRAGDQVEFAVADNGTGIAEADLPRVFGLFEQAGPADVLARGGLGLGLTLVRELVAMHGGEVSAFSGRATATGGARPGSEFVVRLPAGEPPPASAEPPADAGIAARRVLVVDDNRDAADSLRILLQSWGHACDACYDGASAVERIGGTRYDIVFLDIGLPDISGHALARRLQAERDDPPLLIALSGFGQESDREASMDAGFFAHAVKPLGEHELRRLLARAAAATAPVTGMATEQHVDGSGERR